MRPEITNVKIYPYYEDKVKYDIVAYADIELDNSIEVSGVSIIRTKKEGFFISFPIKRFKGHMIEVVRLLNNEYRKYLRKRVLDEYRKYIGEENGS